MALVEEGGFVEVVATWTQAGALQTPVGSPGGGCLLKDPKHPVIPGINTDDVSKLCISRCIVN